MRALLAALFIALAPALPAADLASANARMASGDAAGAASEYEKILSADGPSSDVYANLGLAFEKTGRPLDAALAFHRALALDRKNAAARTAIPPASGDWREQVALRVNPAWLLFSGTFLAWFGAFLLVLAIGLGAPRGGKIALAIAILLAGASIAWVGFACDPRQIDSDLALIMNRQGTIARNSPADSSQAVGRADAGSAVGILAERGPWAYVRLPEGTRGWIPSADLARVIPRDGP